MQNPTTVNREPQHGATTVNRDPQHGGCNYSFNVVSFNFPGTPEMSKRRTPKLAFLKWMKVKLESPNGGSLPLDFSARAAGNFLSYNYQNQERR
jgi:hypothetical protein